MDNSQIDIQQLRIKHILYKSKVRSVLYGGAFDEAFFSGAGPVSSWFTTVGFIRYANVEEIEELAECHQELNSKALSLFRLYNNGKIDQAHDGMKDIELLSDRFLYLLSRLEERVSA